MKSLYENSRTYSYAWIFMVIIFCGLFTITAKAQQTNISDYVIFGGTSGIVAGQTAPASPGYGVVIGSSSSIQGGSVGSYKLVKSTGIATVNANIYSGGTIQLANSNLVSGNLAAGSSTTGVPGTIISIGSGATIGVSGNTSKGNINSNGNVIVGGGNVYGKVTLPGSTYTYSGPTPAGGVALVNLTLPGLPQMPAITPFTAVGTNVSSGTISPGSYGNLTLGNNTLTLNGPGTYKFKSIKTSGPNARVVYNFKNTTTGDFLIYVEGDVSLNKTSFSMVNGGAATRIFMEIHGNGSTNTSDITAAFIMSNGSNGSGNVSGLLGSLWVPYAAIKVGEPNGPSMSVMGALWSGTQVNIGSGVSIVYAPFNLCSPPNANAGLDVPLDFVNQTTLNGTSSTSNVTFSWSVLAGSGGVITSAVNAPTITVSTAGKYILTVTSTAGCFARDTASVTAKVDSIIGSELQAVYQTFNSGGTQPPFFQIQSDKIFIDVIVKKDEYANVKTILTSPTGPWGLTNLLGEDESNFIITGLFSISKLAALNTDPVLKPRIVYVRPYYRAFNNRAIDPPATGIVTSQGDTSIRSHLVRKGYGLTGEGIKIGVLSNSFGKITSASTTPVINSTAAQDISNGDLPGPGNLNGYLTAVTVLKDATFPQSDEGRAMLQIIHDIVPKAQLFFRTGVETANDFAAGIRELKAAGCDVITDDLTYINEPFLKDGVVATAVKEVTDAGATYITSAGNFANKSFEFPYNPMPAPGSLTGTAHNFSGGGDAFLSANLSANLGPGNFTIVLQWLDDIYSQGETTNGGTKNDLDIYLTPNIDGTALFGFNRNNLGGDPIEFLPFTLTTSTQTNFLIINNTTTSNPARFKVVIFQGDVVFNEYVIGGGSTIVGQSNALGAITVGAARYDKVSPPYAGPLAIESFSSIGGTFVNGTARNKPDLVGPDGVSVTVNMGADYVSVNDPDTDKSNFFGTSAAAPHVAAVAALIKEAKRKFLGQEVSAPDMKTLLQTTAIPMGAENLKYGAGFINADAAMRTFAAPDPTLIQLHVPTGVTPGPAPFTLTVTGLNLSPTSVVQLGGVSLTPTNYVNSELLTVQVPAYIGDPAITVYTLPLTNNTVNPDGGTSDPLKFTDVPKRQIVVTADNKSKKYAQNYPAFTATITVDGKTMAQLQTEFPGQTGQQILQAFGLDEMTITSTANNDVNSDVGTYLMTPSRTFVLGDTDDDRLLELYNYTFNTGTLTIEKLDVTVTANNIPDITYGEKLPDVQFSYTLTNPGDAAGNPGVTAFVNSLSSTHQAQLAKDGQNHDILGLVNKAAVTISNGQILAISNGQTVTFSNGQALTIVNGQTLAISNAQTLAISNSGEVSGTIDYNLTNTQIQNMSFQASAQALLNSRQITNQNNATTKVIDLTQESILDFNENAAQTTLQNSVSAEANMARGLVDIGSFTNKTALTISNGQTLAISNGQTLSISNSFGERPQIGALLNGQILCISNGQTLTLSNGQIVTLSNGQIVTFSNGQFVTQNGQIVTFSNGQIVTLSNGQIVTLSNSGQEPVASSQGRSAVIINSADIGDINNNNTLQSLNVITGLGAGQQYIMPGTLGNPNLNVLHVAGIVNILQVPVVITPNPNQTKIYGNADPVFTYSVSPVLKPGDNFTGALGRVAGETVAGSPYAFTLGTLSAGNNYTLVLGGTNKFTITAKPVSITPNAGQSKIYGDADPVSFTFTNNGALAAGAFTGALSRTSGSNVGLYAYSIGTLTAGTNYSLSIVAGNKFEIKKAALQVKADLKWIDKGNPLPALTSVITGLKNGDNPTATHTVSPAYSKYSSPAGLYSIIPSLSSFANAGNYTITYTNGPLYVNPKGSGADDVDTYLSCIDDRGSSYSPANRRYVAHFYAKNTNSKPVYVPVGDNNKLSSSTNSFDGSQQPVIFLPGNGTTSFLVPFDGVSLKWQVKSWEINTLVTESVTASSSSNKCTNLKPAIKTTVVTSVVSGIDEINATIYPNPATTRVIINTQQDLLSEKDILLYDVSGRSCAVKVTRRISGNSIELDISRLANGFYIIRIKQAGGNLAIRFIKR